MDAEILVTLVLAAGAIWLLTHLFPARHQPKLGEAHARRLVREGAASASHEHLPFQAVSVRPEATCCAGARSIQGRRYLVNEAPLIPLPDCSRPRCHCVYAHHPDRRGGTHSRRGVLHLKLDENRERRAGVGRRAADLATA